MATQLPPLVRERDGPRPGSRAGTGRINTSHSQRLKSSVSRRTARGSRQGRGAGGGGGGGLASARLPAGLRPTLDYELQDSRAVLEPSTEGSSLRRDLCLELLTTGHVESFGEMFTLTKDNAGLSTDEALLVALQQDLSLAEQAQRSGDTVSAHGARLRLAEQVERAGEARTALHFRRSCLDFARGETPEQRVASHLQLGLALEKQGQAQDALSCYEGAHEVVTEAGLTGQVAVNTCTRLTHAYLAASQPIVAGDPAAAKELCTRALARAEEAGDDQLLSLCHYALGEAHQKLGDSAEAMQFLDKFMDTADEYGDAEKKCRACSLLARCYEAKGDTEVAQQYYLELVKNCKASGQHAIVADACCQLGRLALAQGDASGSAQWYADARQAAATAKDGALGRAVAVKLALARGRALAAPFRACVAGNKPADLLRLLDWKSRRANGFTPDTSLGFPVTATTAATAPTPPAEQPAEPEPEHGEGEGAAAGEPEAAQKGEGGEDGAGSDGGDAQPEPEPGLEQ